MGRHKDELLVQASGDVGVLWRLLIAAAAGNPCASRMISLESSVPAIGTPGSETGGRKRAYGLRTAARPRKRRTSHRALPVTRLPSTNRSRNDPKIAQKEPLPPPR